jgi:hypothetical protein
MHHRRYGEWIRAFGYGFGHYGVAALRLSKAPVDTMTFDERFVDWGASWATSAILKRVDARAIAPLRRRNFCALADGLAAVARLPIRGLPDGAGPAYFPIRVRNRPRFRATLAAKGIETVDFWSVGSEPAGVFAEVERLRREVVCVPVHQDLELEHIERLIVAIKQAAPDV